MQAKNVSAFVRAFVRPSLGAGHLPSHHPQYVGTHQSCQFWGAAGQTTPWDDTASWWKGESKVSSSWKTRVRAVLLILPHYPGSVYSLRNCVSFVNTVFKMAEPLYHVHLLFCCYDLQSAAVRHAIDHFPWVENDFCPSLSCHCPVVLSRQLCVTFSFWKDS